jgi:hypothetical protein
VKDRFPKWWFFILCCKVFIFKVRYNLFLADFFYAPFTIIMDEHVRPEAYLYAITSCLLLFGPFAINYVIAKKRKKDPCCC